MGFSFDFFKSLFGFLFSVKREKLANVNQGGVLRSVKHPSFGIWVLSIKHVPALSLLVAVIGDHFAHVGPLGDQVEHPRQTVTGGNPQ